MSRSHLVKRFFSGIILLILCAYSTWAQMQVLAIVSIVLLLCIIFIDQSKAIYYILMSLIKQTKQAKLGQLELLVENKKSISAFINKNFNDELLNVIVPNLTIIQLALLVNIGKDGNHKFAKQHLHTLRELREHSLINHDKNTLQDSDYVYLSSVGLKVYQEFSK